MRWVRSGRGCGFRSGRGFRQGLRRTWGILNAGGIWGLRLLNRGIAGHGLRSWAGSVLNALFGLLCLLRTDHLASHGGVFSCNRRGLGLLGGEDLLVTLALSVRDKRSICLVLLSCLLLKSATAAAGSAARSGIHTSVSVCGLLRCL